MDKNRVLRTRRGSMFASEKDRQKRPGTPHRNPRPKNLMRASESAVPIHASFSDRSEEECFPRNHKNIQLDDNTLQKINDNTIDEPQFYQASSTAQIENSSSETSMFMPRVKTQAINSPASTQRATSELGRSAVVSQRSRTRLVKNKSSQGTNTSTTSKGLPPLDGIHAGIGVGPGYSEVTYQDNDFLNSILNTSEDEEEKDREILKKLHRLVVPPTLVFESSCDRRNSFGAIIKFQNISEYFMTYCVKCSESEMFVITPNIGMIGPCCNQEVFVKTNPRFEFTFKDIASEVFKIFATPVYTRNQMKPEKLRVLWRAFGSNFFPRIAAEEHTINYLHQYFPKYTPESLLSAISCNHRWLNSMWGNTKHVRIKSNQISEEEFYSVWPLEDDQYNFMTCKNQMDGWFWHLKNMKRQTRHLKIELRQCIGHCVLFLFISVLIYSSFHPVPPSFKMPSYFDMFDWLGCSPKQSCHNPNPAPPGRWEIFKEYLGF